MRLAEAKDVIDMLGIEEGAVGSAQVALDVTCPAVSAKIGTPFKEAEYTDWFSYQPPKYRDRFQPVTFRLTAAFVDAATFVARMSSTGAVLSSKTDGVAIDASYYTLDPDKGTVTLLADVTCGIQTVLFSYSAGFSESDGVLQGIPDWLKQGGIVAAAKLLRVNPANIAKQKANIFKDIQSALLGEASVILNPHIRTRMGVIFPDRSVAEE